MQVSLGSGKLDQQAVDAVIVGVVEKEKVNWEWLKKILKEEGWEGKLKDITMVHSQGKIAAKRVIVVGLGKKGGMTSEVVRRGIGTAIVQANKSKVRTIALDLQSFKKAEAIVTGAVLANYRFDKYQKDSKGGLKELIILSQGVDGEINKAMKVCQGVMWARDLVNEPPMVVTPKYLAQQAQNLARKHPQLTATIHDEAALKKMGAGALLAVSRGSDEPSYLIHLVYKPEGKTKRKLAILGKGLTFDSGGYSLKPAEGMQTMKLDMAGAATVLGVFRALAEIKPQIEVHGIIPAAENLVSGRAIKPGDVVRAMNGKTVEILNTDAEGRLILADALSYIGKQKWDAVIDVATLTGACMVALGEQVAGLFSNDRKLEQEVMEAAKREGEMVWPMPLVEEYQELIKSQIAEIQNVSKSKWGGAITAALFLKEFVPQNTAWAHLDIAGPAFEEKGEVLPYVPIGGTGFGVRTLLRWLTG